MIIIIGVRFNNLLLFNLVFRLPIGDETEPVQWDVNVIIFIKKPRFIIHLGDTVWLRVFIWIMG